MIYKTLQFDQYSRLDISSYIFWFSAKISKTNLKFEKSFSQFCRARWEKFIDIKNLRFKIKTNCSYSFEDRGTDGQNRFRIVPSMTFQMIYDTPTKAEK